MVPTISTLPLELSLQTAQPELSHLTHLYSSPSRSPPMETLTLPPPPLRSVFFLEPPSPPNHTSSRSQQEWKALAAILLSQIPHLYHDSTLHPAWTLFLTSLKRITDHSASNKSIYQELLFFVFSLFILLQPAYNYPITWQRLCTLTSRWRWCIPRTFMNRCFGVV